MGIFSGIFASNSPPRISPASSKAGSPSLFNSDFENTANEVCIDLENEHVSPSLHISPQPIPYCEQMNDVEPIGDNDSFDGLSLNFAVDQTSKVKITEKPSSHRCSDNENDLFSDEDDYKCRNDMNHSSDDKSSKISRLESLRDTVVNLSRTVVDDYPSLSVLNSIALSPEIKSRSPSILENNETNIFNEMNSTLRNEMFKDFSLLESSKRVTPIADRTRELNQPFANISPVLSFKKSNKKLSRTLFPVKDRSPSIHFDSTFEVDDDFSINLQNNDKSKNNFGFGNKPVNDTPKNNFSVSKGKPVNDDNFFVNLQENDKPKNNIPVTKDKPVDDDFFANLQNNEPKNNFSATNNYPVDDVVDDDFFENFQNNDKGKNNFSVSKDKPVEDNDFFVNLQNDDKPNDNSENKVTQNSPEPAPNIDDWDPDCELFDDDDSFDEIAANVVTPFKETVTVKTSTPAIKPQSAPEKSLPKAEKPKTDECGDNLNLNFKKKTISDFFSNFSSSLKRRSQNSEYTIRRLSPVEESKKNYLDDDDSADEFPWMTKRKSLEKPKSKVNDEKPAEAFLWTKKSPILESPISHITPNFRKPGSCAIRSSKSKSVTPSTPHTGNSSDHRSVCSESTPDLIVDRNLKKKKKNINLKRNLVSVPP